MLSVFRNKVFVVAFYLFCSAFVFGMWVWGADSPYTSFNGDPRSTLTDLLHGTAHKPFVERMLVPLLTRGIYALAPEDGWNQLRASLLEIPKVQKETLRLGWETHYLPEYLIALTLVFGALVGFTFVCRAFFSTLYLTDQATRNALPIGALLSLPPFFHVGTHYIYDFPALLFFTMGLLFMVQKRWSPYYLVYLGGCLNKETMVILTVAFLLLFHQRMKRRTMVLHVGAQVAVFAVTKAIVMYHFAPNPGHSFELHIFRNIHYLLLPYTVITLLVGVIIIALVFYDFRQKHFVLQRTTWLIVPFGVLMILFGLVDEVRTLYEIFPIYFLLIAHTVLFSFLRLPYRLRSVPGSDRGNNAE